MAKATETLNEYNRLMGVAAGTDLFQGFIDLCMKGYAASTLDARMNQLILICVVIAMNSSDVIILSHVKMYVDAGGTREDLVSALNLCTVACGGPGLAWGAVALDAYDEFTAAK
ncbi:MAG: carboxymuconolactone decarboxylase family protein [Mogibacterium sp.]|nr:carboxymuconolactone decarboxylase family protein [Mogibacterium sp.]